MRILILVLMFLTTALHAAEPNRVAMVVGNNLYGNLDASDQLVSAHNDAASVAKILKQNGFTVFEGMDLTRGEFIQMLFDFTGTLRDGDIAVFFFAGHGISIDGANYLLPSDIPATAASRRLEAQRLASLSVHEQAVLAAMKDSGAAVSLAILDACRDNPLKNAAGRSIGATRGLARMDIPQGTFSIYSAGYGQVALDRLPSDGKDANSVFTRVLLRKLAEPGMTVRQLALSTRAEVRELAASAGHVQSPAYYDELGTAEPVMLTLPAEETVTEPAAPRASAVEDEIEMMIIDEIRDSSDPAELQAYLDTYPDGRFAAIARARLRRHSGDVTASAEDLAAALKKIEDLTSARQADQMMIRALQVALEDAKARVEVAEAELAAALSAAAKNAESDGSKEVEDLRKRLAAALATAAVAKQEIEDLYGQLAETQARQLAAEAKVAEQDALIEDLGAQLNAALARLALEQRKRAEVAERHAALEREEDSKIATRGQEITGPTAAVMNARLRKAIDAARSSSYRRIDLNVGDENGISLRVSTLFEADGVTLSDDGKKQLLQMRYQLRTLDTSDVTGPLQLEIIGHTDASGSEATNMRLSLRRAETVAAMFNYASVTGKMKVVARGMGEEALLRSGNTLAANRTNRRIEFRLSYDG